MFTELIKSDVLASKQLTANQKRILSFIREREDKPLSGSYIAKGLNLSRSVITAGIKKLLFQRAIEKTYRTREGQHYKFTFRGHPSKKFFLLLNSGNSGYSSSKMLVMSYLEFRQGENGRAWPYQETIADDLGYKNRSQISRITHALAQSGDLDLKQGNGGKKQGNKYTVLSSNPVKFIPVLNCGAEIDNGVQNRTEGITTSLEFKYNKANDCFAVKKEPQTSGLRAEEKLRAAAAFVENDQIQKKYGSLIRQGVKSSVAMAIAENKSISFTSILNAIANGYTKEKQSGGSFTLQAGYLVKTVNMAIEKGCSIELSRAAQKEKSKMDKVFNFVSGGRLSDEQFSARKRELLRGAV